MTSYDISWLFILLGMRGWERNQLWWKNDRCAGYRVRGRTSRIVMVRRKRNWSRTMIFYLFLKYVNRLKILVAHVDVRYSRIFGNECASGRIRNFHKCAWCVSAFAREEERVTAALKKNYYILDIYFLE